MVSNTRSGYWGLLSPFFRIFPLLNSVTGLLIAALLCRIVNILDVCFKYKTCVLGAFNQVSPPSQVLMYVHILMLLVVSLLHLRFPQSFLKVQT